MSLLQTLGDVASGFSSVGAIANGISAVGSLFGGSSSPSQEELMKWQEDMMRAQFAFNSIEAEKNRTFQADEAAKAREWNSIGSQLDRAVGAGVNPYYLVGSGSYGSAAGSPMGAGSQAPGATVPIPAPNTRLQRSEEYNAVAAAFANITQGASNLANAKESGVNTTYMEKAMNDLLAKLKNEKDYQSLLNNFQSIVNQYEDERQRKQLTEITFKIENLISQGDVNIAMIDKIKAEIGKDVSQMNLNRAEYNQINRFLDGFFTSYWNSVVEKNKASAQADRASSVNSLAQAGKASAETELIHSQKVMVDLTNDLKKATNSAQKESLVNQYIQQGIQSGIMTDIMKEQLEKAMRDNDWATVEKILNSINSLTESFRNVGVGFGAVGGSLSSGQSTVIGGFHP